MGQEVTSYGCANFAVLHKEEDLYIAECPKVGTVSQDYSIEEAVANLRSPNSTWKSFRDKDGSLITG